MKTLESILIKLAAIASTVSGAATAAAHGLPLAESAILTAAGPVVYLVERYWANIKKAL